MKYLLLFAFAIAGANLYAQPWALLVKDVCPGSCGAESFYYTSHNNLIYYMGNDAANGNELWTTDGTAANTRLVKDINPGPFTQAGGNSYPHAFCNINGNMIFRAMKTNVVNYTLWTTDGTSGGTKEVGSSVPVESNVFMPLGSIAYFVSNDAAVNPDIKDLWKTDGTAAGTQKIGYIYTSAITGMMVDILAYATLNSKLYFAVKDQKMLWVTDGTTAGTDHINMPAGVVRMTVFQNKLYFIGDDQKLYVSDGSALGTKLISDLVGMASKVTFFGATTKDLVVVNNKIWKSNGSSSGTRALTPASSYAGAMLTGNKLYYVVGYQNTVYLSMTDLNTEKSITIDTNITVSTHSAERKAFISFMNKLYFDGTPVTTAADGVKTYGKRSLHAYDLNNGSIKPIQHITAYLTSFASASLGNELFLTANDSISGMELWKITDFPTDITQAPKLDHGIAVYPNPVKDVLILQQSSSATVAYSIVNLYGQILQQGTLQQKAEINVAYLPSGVYNITIQLPNNEMVTKRFVKQ
ncbi:MAG TPA: T9SS type A sorting domain-containing protein [Flavipsychrobacter sp.]